MEVRAHPSPSHLPKTLECATHCLVGSVCVCDEAGGEFEARNGIGNLIRQFSRTE